MPDNKQRRGAKGRGRAPLKATQPKSAKKQKKGGPLPGTVENSLKNKGGFHERFDLDRIIMNVDGRSRSNSAPPKHSPTHTL